MYPTIIFQIGHINLKFLISKMLLAGGGADYTSAHGGAFTLSMGNIPSRTDWSDGSAIFHCWWKSAIRFIIWSI